MKGLSMKRNTRKGDEGSILLIVMLVMMVLLGLGVMVMWLTGANLQTSAVLTKRTEALYVAEAGLERARAIINAASAPDLAALLAGSNPGLDKVPGGLDASGHPVGVGALLTDGGVAVRNVMFPPASFGRSSGTADAPLQAMQGQYTVWVRNDLSDVRKGQYTVDTNGTFVVRSRGLAADGRTEVVIEATMVPAALLGGAPHAAGMPADRCRYSGKNACDDNSSVLAGVRFSL
jgi:Tfp pilus assembly protein PilX